MVFMSFIIESMSYVINGRTHYTSNYGLNKKPHILDRCGAAISIKLLKGTSQNFMLVKDYFSL